MMALRNLFQVDLVRNDPVSEPMMATTAPEMGRKRPSGSKLGV